MSSSTGIQGGLNRLRRLLGGLRFLAALALKLRRPPEGPLAQAELLSRTSVRFCALHGIKVVKSGPLPPPGPKVFVMNHLGYIDPLVLAGCQSVLPIAKSEVGRWPLVGRLSRSLGVHFVRRGEPTSGFRVLRSVISALGSGASVLNFPEGTTSRGDDVLPFHRGIFGAARIAGVPVVPVRLRFEDPDLAWVGDDAFVPHFFDFAGRARVTVYLEMLPALDARAASSAEALSEAARVALRDRVRGVPREDRSPAPRGEPASLRAAAS